MICQVVKDATADRLREGCHTVFVFHVVEDLVPVIAFETLLRDYVLRMARSTECKSLSHTFSVMQYPEGRGARRLNGIGPGLLSQQRAGNDKA